MEASTTTVLCHGCQGVLTVPSGTYFAPFICPVCRRDRKKLKAARELMETFIGKAQPREGFD